METNKLAIVAIIISAFSVGAYADRVILSPQTDIPAFMEIDSNSNNLISKEEANKSKSTWLVKSFNVIDKNQDGVLDKVEYEEAKKGSKS